MSLSIRIIAAAAAVVLTLSPAPAQTWSGLGGNGLWNNAGNWTGGIPGNATTTAVTLTGTSQLTTTQDIANPFNLNSLTFNATAGAFTVGGSELRFGGTTPALTQSSPNPITITAPVSFNAAGSIGGTGAGSLTLGSLHVRQFTLTLNRNVTVNGLTLGTDGGQQAVLNTGTSVLTLGGNVTFVQLTDPAGGFADTPRGIISGTLNLGGADRTFAGTYGGEDVPFIDLEINAVITGTGGFIKGGHPTDLRSWMLLSAPNTYTGQTLLETGSERLYLGVDNALPDGTALTVRDGSSLFLMPTSVLTGTAGFNQSVGSLSDGGTAGGILQLGQDTSTAVLTVGGNNTSTTFAGAIRGGGRLIKVGTGTLTLVGNGTLDHDGNAGDPPVVSTYSGGTTVSAGTLLVNGQTGTNSGTGTGTVTVNATGTLGGNGRVGGAVTLAGRIQGGNGTTATANPNLTTGAVTFLGGSSTRVAVGGASQAAVVNSRITTAAAFNGSGVMTINLFNDGTLNVNGLTAYTITVANFGSTNTTATNYSVLADNFGFVGTPLVNLTGTTLSVTFTPVPEPVTVLGLAVAGLAGLRLVRRRGGK